MSMKNKIISLILVTTTTFVGAWVFMCLYNLFVVKALGVKPISYWLAFGLEMLLGLIKNNLKKDTIECDDLEDVLINVLAKNVYLLFTLGIGALVSLGI